MQGSIGAGGCLVCMSESEPGGGGQPHRRWPDGSCQSQCVCVYVSHLENQSLQNEEGICTWEQPSLGCENLGVRAFVWERDLRSDGSPGRVRQSGCDVSLSRVIDTHTGASPVQGELDYSRAEW